MSKWIALFVVVSSFGFVSCGSPETCTASLTGTACAKGTVEACCTATQCRYKTSDGKSFSCEATDCSKAGTGNKSAAVAAAEWCAM